MYIRNHTIYIYIYIYIFCITYFMLWIRNIFTFVFIVVEYWLEHISVFMCVCAWVCVVGGGGEGGGGGGGGVCVCVWGGGGGGWIALFPALGVGVGGGRYSSASAHYIMIGNIFQLTAARRLPLGHTYLVQNDVVWFRPLALQIQRIVIGQETVFHSLAVSHFQHWYR